MSDPAWTGYPAHPPEPTPTADVNAETGRLRVVEALERERDDWKEAGEAAGALCLRTTLPPLERVQTGLESRVYTLLQRVLAAEAACAARRAALETLGRLALGDDWRDVVAHLARTGGDDLQPVVLGLGATTVGAIRQVAAALDASAGADIEGLAEAVHQAYLDTCARLGWPVKPENAVPYAELSEASKELDRASVRAVLAARARLGAWRPA